MMLLRVTFRTGLGLLLLSALLVGLIRAQLYRADVPHDIQALVEFGTPPITTIFDLEAVGRRHPWVETARFSRGMELESGYLQWTWSGRQPNYVDADRDGALWVQNGQVQWVDIPTTLAFGDLWLSLPLPQETMIFTASVLPKRILYQADYLDGRLKVRTEILCPSRVWSFWSARVILRLQMNAGTTALLGQFPTLPQWGGCR